MEEGVAPAVQSTVTEVEALLRREIVVNIGGMEGVEQVMMKTAAVLKGVTGPNIEMLEEDAAVTKITAVVMLVVTSKSAEPVFRTISFD